MVFGDACFEEVFFFFEVHDFAHPGEGIGSVIDLVEINAFEASVGDKFEVFAHERGVHTEDAFGEAVLCVCVFEIDSSFDFAGEVLFEFFGPDVWIFADDGVDQVGTKSEVHAFIAEDVLELFSDADHFVVA